MISLYALDVLDPAKRATLIRPVWSARGMLTLVPVVGMSLSTNSEPLLLYSLTMLAVLQ
jgi:hypothetical protein